MESQGFYFTLSFKCSVLIQILSVYSNIQCLFKYSVFIQMFSVFNEDFTGSARCAYNYKGRIYYKYQIQDGVGPYLPIEPTAKTDQTAFL